MTSDRDRWQRARALFDELVDLGAEARRSRLEELACTDAALHADVARLLEADEGAESALGAYRFGAPEELPSERHHDPLGIVGRTVSHYAVVDFIAAGGMGVVYSANDLTLGRAVALKFPLPHQQVEATVKERFINEARSVAALDHPALCTIHEIGESEHGVFLAMPLYPGETLKETLAREGRLEPSVALEILRQVTAGLVAAHAAGIVHRDLKPGNVMVLPDGGVKVLDFGLAKILDVDLTRSKAVLGTISYVAPEQLRGARADARVDLWALGVMLHEMLTGEAPFGGEHELSVLHAILHEDPARPRDVNPDLGPQYDVLVGALLQKEPGDRYQTAQALLDDINALQRGAAPAVRIPYWGRTALRRRARKLLLPASAVALVGVTAVALGGRTTRPEPGSGLTWVGDTAEVASTAELLAALDPANAGRVVWLRAGEYALEQPIAIPDGMTVQGAGVMRFDSAGRPSGFAEETRTSIRMRANVGGDLVSLGDGATLRNLAVVDMPGRSGNIVAVVSRRAGDTVTATLSEVVIENPNPLAIGPGGALGRGLYVVTINPNMGAEPLPHEGAVLAVRLERSLIHSPSGGGGLFAYNFAADSRIAIEVARSVVGGSSEANGGVSRPDAVHDSEVHITSTGTLYRNDWADPCVSPLLGWNLTGGSGAPIPLALPATRRNRLIVRSVDDRLEGFTTTVLATGSRRFFAEPLNAAPTDNEIDLRLSGTVIASPSCGSAGMSGRTMGVAVVRPRAAGDFVLAGAWVENDGLHAGDRNTVRMELRNVTGSGVRENQYFHAGSATGPAPTDLQGNGNRLEIIGDPGTFRRENRGIDPAPLAEFFIGTRQGP